MFFPDSQNPTHGYPDAEKPLVIYHGGCRDGFAAAWAVWKAYPNAEFFAGFYGQPPPEVKGREVIMVDFSYPYDPMRGIIASAKGVVILDHHKTAEADLKHINEDLAHMGIGPATIVFDMERSGAGITWDYFHADRERWCGECGAENGHISGCANIRPWLIDYVEDRDLWRWKLGNSRLMNAYLGAIPFNFEDWDIASYLTTAEGAQRGAAIQMKIKQYCEEVGKNAIRISPSLLGQFPSNAFTENIPLVNAPQCDISELLEHLMDTLRTNFVMGWFQRSDSMFQYSLRSRGDFDVSAIAKSFGGGGHKNAAGFQLAKPIHF